jgi:hypothetical protein
MDKFGAPGFAARGRGRARVPLARLVAACIAALAVGAGAGAARGDQAQPLMIEGPGYGGTADELSVAWVQFPSARAAPSALIRPLLGTAVVVPAGWPSGGHGQDGGPADPEILRAGDSQLGLSILGVGFRGRSTVTLRIGESDPVIQRTDATGTLALQVVGVAAAATRPGMSVVAIGRNPAGTTRTLVGAVPPQPSGVGPADLIPWVVAGMVVLALAWQGRRAARAGRPGPPGGQGTTVQPSDAA